MKLIIDIDESLYKATVNGLDANEIWNLRLAVKNGTPLDDLRAMIIEEKECAYAYFDKYKVDYLGVDSRYVEDELPYDDFRYGMERCLEIIDKHTKKNIRHLKYAGEYADQDTMMPAT